MNMVFQHVHPIHNILEDFTNTQKNFPKYRVELLLLLEQTMGSKTSIFICIEPWFMQFSLLEDDNGNELHRNALNICNLLQFPHE